MAQEAIEFVASMQAKALAFASEHPNHHRQAQRRPWCRSDWGTLFL